jgi:hypothetical protein
MTFSSNGTLVNATANLGTSGAQELSPDAIGNIYTGDYNSTSPYSVQKWSYTTGGVVGSTPTTITTVSSPWSLAVDRANNVWAGLTTTSSANFNLVEIAAGSSTAVGVLSTTEAPVSQTGTAVFGVAVDPDQNIWIADNSASAGEVSVVQNTGTVSAPTYTFQVGTGSAVTTPAGAITTSSVGGGAGPFGLAFVKNTNSATSAASPFIEWTSFYAGGVTGSGLTTVGLLPITPTLTGAEVTSVSSGTLVTTNSASSYLQFATSDGDGTVVGANKNGSDLMVIQNAGSATPNAPFYLAPCYMSTASTACNTTFNGLREVNIDSTGSMWVAMGTIGNVLQIIGSAAPTWPLLSLGVLGRP